MALFPYDLALQCDISCSGRACIESSADNKGLYWRSGRLPKETYVCLLSSSSLAFHWRASIFTVGPGFYLYLATLGSQGSWRVAYYLHALAPSVDYNTWQKWKLLTYWQFLDPLTVCGFIGIAGASLTHP